MTIDRLTTALLADLDAVDQLMCPEPYEAKQQKLGLIIEAMRQAARAGYDLRDRELTGPDAEVAKMKEWLV